MELTEGDSLEGSAHTPIYNPHILPLTLNMLDTKILCVAGGGGIPPPKI